MLWMVKLGRRRPGWLLGAVLRGCWRAAVPALERLLGFASRHAVARGHRVHSFASGLRRDQDAVIAGLTSGGLWTTVPAATGPSFVHRGVGAIK